MKRKRKKDEPTMAVIDQKSEPGKIVGIIKDGRPIDISEIKVGFYDFEMKDGELHVTFSEDQKPKP